MEGKPMFIIDWDDTICPTSEIGILLKNKDINKLESDEFKNYINLLSSKIIEFFDYILKINTFVIISNADISWIEESSKKFMPLIYNYLIKNDIEIIYNGNDFKNVIDSKLNIFQQCIDEYTLLISQPIDVISLGDGIFERYALLNTKNNKIRQRKNIKFLDQPTFNELIFQYDYLTKTFNDIINYNGNLDIQIIISYN